MRRVNDILFISIGIIDASLLGDSVTLKKSLVFCLLSLDFFISLFYEYIIRNQFIKP